MQYKLLKQFDKDSIPVGDTFDIGDKEYCVLDFDDSKISVAWLIKEGYIKPVEKKRYEDLKSGQKGDHVWYIDQCGGELIQTYFSNDCRSETFLTREEAEDEHKRREWAVRPDKFIPKLFEDKYYYPAKSGFIHNTFNEGCSWDIFCINAGLAFKDYDSCEKAMKEHDLVRLFYTIR